jgi:hypothetical protein
VKTNGIALFLPGGGAAGAMYQIAVLAALEDAVEGLNANEFDLFSRDAACPTPSRRCRALCA